MTDWPALPYAEWRPTRDTLHMYTQVVGKLRLALSPFEPEWANVALHVTARGLSTPPLPVGLRTFDAELDLLDHVLILRSSDGRVEHRPLGGSVADFYADVMRALARLDINVAVSTTPSEVPDPIPFPDDRTHATYDAAQATRFFDVLSKVSVVMNEHRAGFRGRQTPVHFFWGTFDLALGRYGKPVQPPAGAGVIERFGADAQAICAGWWPGDQRVAFPAFYAYAYPAPDGVAEVAVEPAGAAWHEIGEFVFPYDAAIAEPNPRQAIQRFLASTYAGAAALLGWDDSLSHVAAPTSAPG